jgi:hypothetical protein
VQFSDWLLALHLLAAFALMAALVLFTAGRSALPRTSASPRSGVR